MDKRNKHKISQFKNKIYKCFILCCTSLGNASTATGGGGVLGPVPITRSLRPSVVISFVPYLQSDNNLVPYAYPHHSVVIVIVLQTYTKKMQYFRIVAGPLV